MRNNKGFGIVGLMAMVVIMSIITMASVSMMQNMIKASNMTEAKSSLVILSQDISNIAANDVTCTAAVTQVSQPMVGEIQFSLPNGRVLKKNASTIVYPLNVESFVYSNAALIQTNTDGSKVYYGDLTVQVSPSKQVLGPSLFKPRSVKSIYLTINSVGNILSCGNVSPQVAQASSSVPAQASSSVPTQTKGHDNGGGNSNTNNGVGNDK